jgi:hypothetical protein
MRRMLPVAMLSALLAVAPAALAQHVGTAGHAGGGAHGGFAGHAGGFHSGYSGFHGGYGGFSGARPVGRFGGGAPRFPVMGPHAVSMTPRYSFGPGRVPGGAPVYRPAYGSSYRPAYRPGWDGHGRGRHGHGGRHGDHDRWENGGYGGYGGYGNYGAYNPYAYPFINSWELLPGDLGYSDFSDDETSGGQTANQDAPAQETQPEYEPDSSMPDEGYREEYAPPPPADTEPAASAAPIAAEPRLTLVFKDGHTEQVRNYALTQSALLNLDQADAGRVRRIPLASLNVPATEKAAQQAGLEFSPPAS